jgi:hypothetical protein
MDSHSLRCHILDREADNLSAIDGKIEHRQISNSTSDLELGSYFCHSQIAALRQLLVGSGPVVDIQIGRILTRSGGTAPPERRPSDQPNLVLMYDAFRRVATKPLEDVGRQFLSASPESETISPRSRGRSNPHDGHTSDPDILKGFRQKILVEQGIALIDDEACPLCDTAWDLEKLKTHLQEKLSKASAASAILEKLTTVTPPPASSMQSMTNCERVACCRQKKARL